MSFHWVADLNACQTSISDDTTHTLGAERRDAADRAAESCLS